jgi:membrane peptidoglycan carboxypeptidase
MPDNYDGNFRGPMSLRDALAQSINVVAVKLFYLAGLSDSLKTAEDLGINTLGDISRYGLTLVIGGGEVTLLDLTSAYGVFANNGIRNYHTGILKVEDAGGKVLEEFIPREQEVLPKNTALTISDILSDEKARVPTFGSHSSLYIRDRDVAVKTGTTNSNRDAWTIGYNPALVVGVWAGNNDNTPMKKGGAALAGPIWNKFINEALKNFPDEKFDEPDLETDLTQVKPALRGSWQGNENFFIDRISGKLASPETPKETLEERILTNVHSILYWVDKKDIRGAAPKDPEDDSQFERWDVPIQDWWAKNRYKYRITTLNDKPDEIDDVHTEATKPKILIREPNTQSIYPLKQKIDVKITSSSQYTITKIDAFVNDSYLGTFNPKADISFVPNDFVDIQTENELKLVAHDNVYNIGEATMIFKVQR